MARLAKILHPAGAITLGQMLQVLKYGCSK
jgi:hypothetical protein